MAEAARWYLVLTVLGVGALLRELDPVLLADAPAESDAVGDVVTVELPLGVALEVPLGVPDNIPVALGVGAPAPESLPVALGEAPEVREGVGGALAVALPLVCMALK